MRRGRTADARSSRSLRSWHALPRPHQPARTPARWRSPAGQGRPAAAAGAGMPTSARPGPVRRRRPPARAESGDGRFRQAPDRQPEPPGLHRIGRGPPRADPGRLRSRDPVRVRLLARRRTRVARGRRPRACPLAGPVPYAKPTPKGGVSGELGGHPDGHGRSPHENAGGKIVVRDAATASVPEGRVRRARVVVVRPRPHAHQVDRRELRARLPRLPRAHRRPARPPPTPAPRASCFGHGFPREQVRDHYAPYEGVHWELPAVQVGVDEGDAPQAARRAGTSATIALSAHARARAHQDARRHAARACPRSGSSCRATPTA